jgi:hypothetical protein
MPGRGKGAPRQAVVSGRRRLSPSGILRHVAAGGRARRWAGVREEASRAGSAACREARPAIGLAGHRVTHRRPSGGAALLGRERREEGRDKERGGGERKENNQI